MESWEAVFSTLSVRQLRDATIGKLLEEIRSVRSVPRCYKQDRSRLRLVVRQSPGSKDVNIEAEGTTALEAVTKRQPLKMQQIAKT
jgi:hypothetical protein